MHNQIPIFIGSLTVLGMVVKNETVFITCMLIIAVTSVISGLQMIRHEILRCKRLNLIDVRRIVRCQLNK